MLRPTAAIGSCVLSARQSATARWTLSQISSADCSTQPGCGWAWPSGAAVSAVVVEHQPVPMRILGIRRQFAPTGSASFLLDHFGLNPDGIVTAVRQLTDRTDA